ncbi:putative DNA binding protein SART-1 [Cladophialophora carrionii]|uniref:Putative DNA binding protein SART-1 n=1 Tax=Cladophialophora carrionii TaxID=86049 RepID=A0A1C1CI68_9EURO|nr:putative DNA binding protein SART-1 [Cladophialophora carrionii]
MASAADIEQMNKLRKSLGLPLLNSSEGPTFKESRAAADDDDSDRDGDAEPASTLETREAAGFENWNQLREEEKKRALRERRKKEIQRQRDLEARNRRLEGKGLGDAGDEDDIDTKAWLKGQKKRQSKIEKERAERLARELAEREREAAVEYTSKDLAGVQVAHEIGDFDEGFGEQILTLKDTEIGKGDDSEDGDVLENADIVSRDKLKEKLDLKKKTKTAYNVHEDSEKGLLSQYDDKKRKAFTLDAHGSTVEEREAKRQQIGEKLKNTISLDILKDEPVSDYLELKIKKPKKEKKKSKRQRPVDEDEDVFATAQGGTNGDAMDVDSAAAVALPRARSRTAEDNLNDDDDLASALARTRQAVLRKQKRRPEDIIAQLKQEEDEQPVADGEGGLVLDDTTVFLDNLSSRPRDEEPERGVKKSVEQNDSESPAPRVKQEDEDHAMGEAYAGVEDEQELLNRVKRERSTVTPEVSATGLDEEKSLDQGLGSALSLLRQRGILKETDAGDKNKLYKDRQKFIVEARLREHENEQKARMQRERDRQSGKLTGLSVKEREEHARWQNTQREHQSSIQAAATFNKEYKPDVQIKYVDDDGRLMNQKEAFKHLSHQFHGKGSGKLKTEKHMKKIAEEKKREAASILDSSEATGMNNAQGTIGKKNKQAGIRLG